MPSLHRSLSWAFLEKAVLFGVTLISFVLIARLLAPEEIGIYSVATALIAVGQVLREFGVGNFLIQEKNLTKDHIRTAFGVSLLIGGAMFFLFALGAKFVGQFYHDERITWIVQVVALSFLIMPFCSISLALLRRDMLFGRLMGVNIAAGVAGASVTLALAFADWGPVSLAWGAIAVNTVTGVGAWMARNDHKLLTPSLSEWRSVLSFGTQSAGVAVITTIAMDINDLVVARVMGFAPVAILSRAAGLTAIFNQQVMGAVRSVALPAFAKAHREGKELEPIYVASVTAVTAVAWPFYGFLALHATDILRIMFGPQWDAAASLVPLFCLAAALTATCSLALTLLIGIGHNQAALKADLIAQPLKAVILVGTVMQFKSLEALAWAALFVNVITTPYFWWIKNAALKTDIARMGQGLRASFYVTAACLLIPMVSVFSQSNEKQLGVTLTLIHALVALVGWVFALFWLGHPLSRDPFIVKARTKAVAAAPFLDALLPLKS